MQVVQQILVDNLLNYLDKLIHRSKVKIDGKYHDYTVFKTVQEGNMLRKYIYLDHEIGKVEEAQLLSSMGEVLAIKPFSIEKHEDGLVIAFEFKIIVEETA